MALVKKISVLAVIATSFTPIISAQPNITASTCASPDQFSACMQPVLQTAQDCYARAGTDDDQISKCSCNANLAQIDCALESCWNVVYGCEYQSLAFAWSLCTDTGESSDIPFFPAPDDAPGGCSCNLGSIAANFINIYNSNNTCFSSGNNLTTCFCCETAALFTSIDSYCPENDLSHLGIDVFNLSSIAANASLCQPTFEQYDCVGDLGFSSISTFSYSTDFPTRSGTVLPSTTGGTITAPLNGSVYVVTANSTTTTITALTDTAVSSNSSTTTTASSTGSASTRTSSNTATTSSSSAPAATSSSSAGSTTMARGMLSLSLMMGFYAIW